MAKPTEEGGRANDAGKSLAKVVAQIEQLRAEKGKALLMFWIDEGRMDDAILLMSKMSENS